MRGQALVGFPYPILTVIGLLLFFIFFVSMVFWVFHKSQKNKIKYLENLPLQDNEINLKNDKGINL